MSGSTAEVCAVCLCVPVEPSQTMQGFQLHCQVWGLGAWRLGLVVWGLGAYSMAGMSRIKTS